MSTDTEQFAGRLRAGLDLDGLHSGLEPVAVLAGSRRARRRRTLGLTAGALRPESPWPSLPWRCRAP
ncbi:hypothetical protein [Cellulomonas sp. P24]|uniref:hypothetical protein n=1 Tax=Cellulomonas sp. P24 TaxID=2885206 RepID=UPI00216AF5B5|nr:hypothetical protein [Cellulomonas sp. P24]MCR6490896.1 hypothetical protein [Cellulomonas sp. P24]